MVEPSNDFLILGASATASIVARTKVIVGDIYEHRKPEDLAFDDLQDITELSHKQLGQFMQYFTGVQCFALQGLAIADLDAQAAKTCLDVLKKQYFLMADDKTPKWQMEAEALKDAKIGRAEERNFACKAMHKMMTAQVTALDHKVALYSREISRRSADLTSSGRSS